MSNTDKLNSLDEDENTQGTAMGDEIKKQNNIEQNNIEQNNMSYVLLNFMKKINIKIAIFIFIMCIFIFSDLFIENVLNKFKDSVYNDCPTTKGTIIQSLLLAILYIIIDLLVQHNCL